MMFMGMGLKSTLIKTQIGFRELNSQLVQSNFHQAKTRLIVINSDGVLPMIQKQPL